ncbi:MAG: hypothetical protein FWG10_05425 [Eubacteriaceae bacterium]|nr:hypothetical protein [Eubacteriaceae bacterium]
MIDKALAGTFQVENYDESLLSKVESRMLYIRFLEQSQLKRGQIESERERIRTLISDISHKTKTPLANIELYSQLLPEQDLTGERASPTWQIAASSEKLSFYTVACGGRACLPICDSMDIEPVVVCLDGNANFYWLFEVIFVVNRRLVPLLKLPGKRGFIPVCLGLHLSAFFEESIVSVPVFPQANADGEYARAVMCV